jgi:hypothetical protein
MEGKPFVRHVLPTIKNLSTFVVTPMEVLLLMVAEDVPVAVVLLDVMFVLTMKELVSVLNVILTKDFIYLELFAAIQRRDPSLMFKMKVVSHAQL